MGYDHNRIKSNARLFYQNNTGNSILSILIFLGVSMGAGMAVSVVSSIIGILTGVASGVASKDVNTGITAAGLAKNSLSFIAGIALGAAEFPLMIGLVGWYRSSIYQKTPLGEIFTPYKPPRLWSNIGTMALMTLYTYLWALLFIIPGIIKTYSYSQTMFIKAENPDIPAKRAIELSKVMMEGHKFDIFYLHLSFLGWMLLSGMTMNILGILYVFPYYYAALAFAYEEIKVDAASRGLFDIREIRGY